MKKRSLLLTVFLLLSFASSFSQIQTGTLNVFSEISGINVYLDENLISDNTGEIKNIPVGSHYLKVLKDGVSVYSDIVVIQANTITSVLIKNTTQPQVKAVDNNPVKEPALFNNPAQNQSTGKTGTLNIFSELTGIMVYLDENKQGEDIKQVNNVPAGDHYLKVLKDGVSVFGEIIKITENNVTTVLVKNSGQVAEKILSSKVAEQDEYKNSKLDVLLSRGMTTTTKGFNDIYPGYYSYWGFSKSVSTSTETTDWKIIRGGVKEISEREFASVVENKELAQKIDLQIKKENKTTMTASLIALPCVIVATCILTDMVGSKPWMHKDNPEHPKYETVAAAISIPVGTIAYLIAMKKPYSGHYTTVDNAAKDAQAYNRRLKEKLGLPENYDTD